MAKGDFYAAVRSWGVMRLKGQGKSLSAAEDHAKRRDPISKERVRKAKREGIPPIAWSKSASGPLDYLAAFEAHLQGTGAQVWKGAALALELKIIITPAWLEEAGDPRDRQNPRVEALVREAVAWAESWGGQGSVWAFRYDCDERGSGVVDLFISPVCVYEKKRKDGSISSNLKVSVGKAQKDLLWSLREIEPDLKRPGAAMQSSWAAWASERLDARIKRGEPKERTNRDHLHADLYAEIAEGVKKEALDFEARAQTAHNALKEAEEKLPKLAAREVAVKGHEEIQRLLPWILNCLKRAIDLAEDGEYDREIKAQDMAEKPEEFSVLTTAVEQQKRPLTKGFRLEFWSTHYGNGSPFPLPDPLKESILNAFKRIESWAKAIKDTARKAVEKAASEAQEELSKIRSQANEEKVQAQKIREDLAEEKTKHKETLVEITTREAAVKDQEKIQRLLPGIMGRLKLAIELAEKGEHDQEINAQNSPDEPQEFAVMAAAAEQRKCPLTKGFRSEYWATHFTNGSPFPLPDPMKQSILDAFARIEAWAKAIKETARKAVEKALEEAQGKLSYLKAQADAETIRAQRARAEAEAEEAKVEEARSLVAQIEDLRREQAALKSGVDLLKGEQAALLEDTATTRANLKAMSQRVEAEKHELEQTLFSLSEAASEWEHLKRLETERLEESPGFREVSFMRNILQKNLQRREAENQDLQSQVVVLGARRETLIETLHELTPEKLPALRSRFRQKWEAHPQNPERRSEPQTSRSPAASARSSGPSGP